MRRLAPQRWAAEAPTVRAAYEEAAERLQVLRFPRAAAARCTMRTLRISIPRLSRLEHANTVPQAEYSERKEDLLEKESSRRRAEFAVDPSSPRRRRAAGSADDAQWEEEDSRGVANSYDLSAMTPRPRRRWPAVPVGAPRHFPFPCRRTLRGQENKERRL